MGVVGLLNSHCVLYGPCAEFGGHQNFAHLTRCNRLNHLERK